MYRRYFRRRKSGSNIFTGFLALFVLGAILSLKENPGEFFRAFAPLILLIISFFVMRKLIRGWKRNRANATSEAINIARIEDAAIAPTVTSRDFRMNSATSTENSVHIGQTKEARLLWAALKERGVQGITEYPDGHKHIDIAILPAKLYIEVDGIQHSKNVDQVLADLRRDDYSEKDGFRTIRISNEAIRQDVNRVADEIVRQARERQKIN